MELQQVVNGHEHVGHHHRHGGLKKGHHLGVRGHGGHCGGGHHGHKHLVMHGHGHHGLRRRCHKGHRHRHGHGHGFVIVEEQIKHEGQIIVAHASGGNQPQPENSEGQHVPHHHRRRHHHHGCYRLLHHGHHHPDDQHHRGGQATEAAEGAPNELLGAIVCMRLEDNEPNE